MGYGYNGDCKIARQYIRTPCMVKRLSRERYIAYNLATNDTVVLSDEAAAFITGKPVKHIEEGGLIGVQSRSSKCHAALVDSDLRSMDDLRQAGWIFESVESLCDSISDGQLHEVIRAADTVAIVTSNRPETLMVTLNGVLANRAAHARSYEVLVLDNSSREGRCKTRAVIKEEERRFDARISYIGRRERWQLVKLLKASMDCDRRSLEFGLMGVDGLVSTGASRNVFLLTTVGSMALSMDDDVTCHIASTGRSSGLRIALEDPSDIRFYRTHDEATSNVSFEREDFVAIHERTLGRTLASLLNEARNDVRVDDSLIPPRLLRSILRSEGQIAATWMGVVGDAGIESPHGYLFLAGSNRAALTNREELYRELSTSRKIIRSADATSIVEHPPFMTMASGFDNRQCLPPFVPVLRNQDGLFAACSSLCGPDWHFAHLPFAIEHKSPVATNWNREMLWLNSRYLRVNDLMCSLLPLSPMATSLAGTPAERVRALGAFMSDLAALPPSLFDGIVRHQFIRIQHSRIATLCSQLDKESNQPTQWVLDVKRQISSIKEACKEPHSHCPIDIMVHGLSPREAICRMQRFVGLYGEFTSLWPELRDVARPLCEQVVKTARHRL